MITPQNLNFALYKLGDVTITGLGKAQFQYEYNTQIIMFYNKISQWQTIQDQWIQMIINILYNFQCIRDVGQITVQSGDVGQFNLPSDAGYNSNYMVRKITLNYTLNKVIKPQEFPTQIPIENDNGGDVGNPINPK